MNKALLQWIMECWFDDGKYVTAKKDQYGDTRYVGLHDGRCSEVVISDEKPDVLTVYQIDRGGSYLNAFYSDDIDPSGQYHAKNMELIGMMNNEHDFKFEPVRNYSECHTTVTMIK